MPTAVLPYETAQDVFDIMVIASADGTGPNGMEGNILNEATNPTVLPAVKKMWLYLQQRLISAGVDTFTKNFVINNIPAFAGNNPREPMILGFNGFFDGKVWHGPTVTAEAWDDATTYTQGMTVTYGNYYYVSISNNGTNLNQEPDTSPAFWSIFTNLGPILPPDMIKPLEAWESRAGNNHWAPMRQAPDQFRTSNIQQNFGVWMYENRQMSLPPCIQVSDLKIKALAWAPPIVGWDSPLYLEGAPARALAYLTLVELSGGRGGSMSDKYGIEAEKQINQLINQTVRKMAYSSFARRPFRSRSSGGGRRNGR